MPILITHGDPGVFGQGAADAGFALGRSQRLAQQRQIDAGFIADRLAAREEITRIRAIEDAQRASSQSRGRGGGVSRSDVQDIIEGFARDKKDEKTIESVAEQKRKVRQGEAEGLLSALEQKFEGKEKDITYQYARDQILSGKSVPDKILQELGIVPPTKKKGDETDSESGFEPKTNEERLFRRSLEQGNPSDIAQFLDQKDSSNKFGPAKDTDPLSMDALAARTQLDAFVSTTSDRDILREYRRDLKESGVSDDALQVIDQRDAELAETEMKVKAPAAFEQAVTAFGPQLQAAQDKAGRPLRMDEKRKLLGGILSTTAKSYGLTVDQIGQYVRENDETRRMSEMLIQKAQDSLIDMVNQQEQSAVEEEFESGGAPIQPQSSQQQGLSSLREIETPRTTQ